MAQPGILQNQPLNQMISFVNFIKKNTSQILNDITEETLKLPLFPRIFWNQDMRDIHLTHNTENINHMAG